MKSTFPMHPGFSLMELADQRWENFIKSNIEATIFHHPAWIQVLSDCYGFKPFIAVVCDNTGNIRAGVPMAGVGGWLTGHRWVSLPFSDYCNPLFDDPIWLTTLTDGLMQVSREKSVPDVELRWGFPPTEGILPVSQFVLHTLRLDRDIEKVSKEVHRTQYQNVKRAEREGIVIERGKGLEEMRIFYHLQCLTRRRHGLPVQPWKFFEQLYYQLLERGLGFILLAKQAERYLAGGVFLCMQQTLTYKYAASDDQEKQFIRSNHLLTWNAIQWGCNNGFKRFDFGRCDLEDAGLRTFKIRWGAEESILYYSYFFKPPRQENPSFMPLMQSVIRKSPLWVVTITGELLYKYFG
jgi:hypothetical protein